MSLKLRILTAVMGAVVLLAILSLTLFNKQSYNMRVAALMREGRIATEIGEHDEAIDAYRLAISLNNKNVQAYLSLAEACVSYEEVEDALYFLRLGMKQTNENEKIKKAYNKLLGAIAAEEEEGDDGDVTVRLRR